MIDQCIEMAGNAARLRTRSGIGNAVAPAAPIEGDDAVSSPRKSDDLLLPNRAGAGVGMKAGRSAPRCPPLSTNHSFTPGKCTCAPRRKERLTVFALFVSGGGGFGRRAVSCGVATEFNCGPSAAGLTGVNAEGIAGLAAIGLEPLLGRHEVAGPQRRIGLGVERHKPEGVPDRCRCNWRTVLAIQKGGLEIGVMRPVARLGAVDLGAEKHLGLTARADGAAGLDRTVVKPICSSGKCWPSRSSTQKATVCPVEPAPSLTRSGPSGAGATRQIPGDGGGSFGTLSGGDCCCCDPPKRKSKKPCARAAPLAGQTYRADQRDEKKSPAPVPCSVASLDRHRITYRRAASAG